MVLVSTHVLRPVRAAWQTGAALAVAGLVAAACGTSGGSGGSTGSAGATGSSAAAGGGSSSVVVETHTGPLGTYLTDGSGRTLYMFASDTSTKSTCSGPCLTYWPALTVSGAPTTASGASAGKVGTITGTGGTKQVTYDGHPLYYYSGDSAAGDTNGQGSTNFGARWWLLTPSGQPLTATSSGGGSSTSSGGYSYPSQSSGGGGGYGYP
jgi:predicted lipoprotein with Yx(FWY)xxD motif